MSVDLASLGVLDALKVEFGGTSKAGIKAENQDAFVANAAEPYTRQVKGSLVCLADGASCCDRAQEASQLSVTTFVNDYYSTPETWSVKQSASRVLSSLNSWLNHHGNQGAGGESRLITTFSAVVFKSTTAYVFHVGDSRVYRLRRGQLQQLTRDHVQVNSLGAQRFLTRALGIDSHLQVDVCEYELEQGDVFVLTTDGVHEWVSEAEIQAHILNAATTELEVVAATICRQALAAGSQDNASCILAKVQTLPSPDLIETSRQLSSLLIPPVLTPGCEFDGFQVEAILHSGTRSHVYLALHMASQSRYVLKMPSEHYADDLAYLESVHREQWAGRRLSHPGVMNIYSRHEFQADSRFLYQVCEYVPGCTLRQWLYDNPNPNLTQARALLINIIQAVRALQRQGMLHRDLKPENIMVFDDNRVKLIDLGSVQVSGLEEIASVVDQSRLEGAVGYIAPEYLLAQRGTHQSDIFSIGCIFYEILTGQLPFATPLILKSRVQSLAHWRYRSIRQFRDDLPPWLDAALEKATNPNRAKRYQAMSEMLADVTTPNTSLPHSSKSAPLIERNPVAFWQLVSGLLALGLIVQNLV